MAQGLLFQTGARSRAGEKVSSLMIDFTAIAPLAHQGKHNMASDAFDALHTARETGAVPKGGELSFNDLLDTLNPLQHIPVVSSIYRDLTGDTISPQARVAGGALYGGPIGLVASVFDATVAATTGADLGEHLVAGLTGDMAKPAAVAQTTRQPAVADKPAAPMTPPATMPPAGERPKFAVLDGSERTGSLAAPAVADTRPTAAPRSASQPVPKSMPQLSPDAFNALLNSFADPKAAKAANPALAAASAASAPPAESKPKSAPADIAARPGSKDLASAIEGGLDQLDALKQTHPDMPLANAFADQPSGNGL